MSSVYQINKGIGRPIEFRGLKAQYIGFLAGGLVGLLLLFAALYICGLNLYICITVIGGLGTALFMTVIRMSHKYGEYGLLKKNAKRSIPSALVSRSRKLFTHLNISVCQNR
ncbi:DUF4133 domain-containing protein [Pedobacter frigoris]|uniref:DUF4133 domain-containing protein n=1 Tax=Pedobacter frigoris TaxID=2571272 RepID=A0A4U1CBX3_9SPHI|nr:DUF4133 domain-containing protein [Pedobacter frigoris]TKC04225.1 DUF4133 domain-containing protein [Pedobacter frigoris]